MSVVLFPLLLESEALLLGMRVRKASVLSGEGLDVIRVRQRAAAHTYQDATSIAAGVLPLD